ncbi:hypothetical protein ACIQYF_08580 [Pseudomonas sp. NPDC096917]|uniref:hypothetical protein n=1 Tax=Pseudomonas sp. NPDC096917 TaxID=3364483 RepID=UPI00383B13E2
MTKTHTENTSHQSDNHAPTPKRLVVPPRHFAPNLVSDLLVVMMANVEDALLASGATTDSYNRLDLLKAATPFVVTMFAESDTPPEFVVEWPEHERT